MRAQDDGDGEGLPIRIFCKSPTKHPPPREHRRRSGRQPFRFSFFAEVQHEKNDRFTKTLAITGTVLVWLPSLAPLIFALIALATRGRFLYDYLMPAELFPLALVGGGLLFWAAYRVKTLHKAIGASYVLAAALLACIYLAAVATGLASGETAPGGWEWALVIGFLVAFTLALIAIGVEGIGLLRNLFQPGRHA